MTFLIFAWVIISWPFRMPPSSRPMMTSTMAISTSVKPACDLFMPHIVRAAADDMLSTTHSLTIAGAQGRNRTGTTG